MISKPPLISFATTTTLFFFFFFFFLLLLLFIDSIGATHPPFACNPQDAQTSTFPFCKTSLPIPDRVNDLIGRLSLQEKVQLLVNNATAITRLGIDHYEWWGEALHGVAMSSSVTFGGEYPGATSFPQVITTAASFNASLWEQIGRVVSDEARAMYNGGAAGLTFWSPNVNILRDPRWGRSQETPGEDPLLSGTYAASYVRGLQQNDGDRLKVAACCKHYTAYDLDKWNGVDRFHFSAQVSKQDLEETFDVPFRKCVLEGNVASVMCSYNQVNGKPTCADPDLLKGTIRGDWKLNGYIVSDCDSVQIFYEKQRYTKTPEEAAAVALKAGLDLDCGPYLAVYTEKAIAQKLISEADVNNALFNTFTVQMRLGLYDGEPSEYGNLGAKDVCSPDHQELAVEAAHQGIVLLKNRKSSLPLSIRGHRTIAVIGPNSDVTATMIGNYQGIPCRYITPLQGITDYGATVIHDTGCAGVACVDDQQFGDAENLARQADATVLIMGLDQSIEAEFLDRNAILLPGRQQELISRVAMASKGPTILVIMSGGPIDVSFAKNDPRIGGIIWAGYPGQAGGAAIADILFGTANPGGKLPMTWYPQEYLTKVPMTIMGLRPDPENGYPGRTYRFYKGPVVYPFGHGLSYTVFVTTIAKAPTSVAVSLHGRRERNMTRSSVAVRVTHVKCDDLSVELDVDVKNIGSRDGSETLLIFFIPPTGHGAPHKQLVAFEKVYVPKKAQQRVSVSIDVCKQLSIVDKNGIRRIPLGDHVLIIGNIRHTVSVQASANPKIRPKLVVWYNQSARISWLVAYLF